ncbi:MAG: DMT family transporter [Pseudomonadales bacterium]
MHKLAHIAFWALGIIWGSNFIYMKMAAVYVSAEQIVLLRVFFGFIPVALFALFSGAIKLSHLRHLKHFIMMALLATLAYYYGFAKGTSLLDSGIAGALSGSIPIFALLLALLLKQARPSAANIAGLCTGFLGICLIAAPFDSTTHGASLEGSLYMALGSLSLGASFIYAKRFILPLGISGVALTCYQLGLALLVLLCTTELEGITRMAQDTHTLLGVILGLGTLGTGIAYLSYYYIIDKLGAVTAASASYIPPVVALFIGAVIAGEHIEVNDYLSASLILGAVVLTQYKPSTSRSKPVRCEAA